MIGELFGVNDKQLQAQYYTYLSNFGIWDQKEHASNWLIFPENIGPFLKNHGQCTPNLLLAIAKH